MITGIVTAGEARISLQVRGPQDSEQEIEAVIDTGYTASLSLPPEIITRLDLPWQGSGRGTLADGSECLFDVFDAEIIWDGRRRRILVDEANTEPLLGMALLSGYRLMMDVCADGKVEIAKLPS